MVIDLFFNFKFYLNLMVRSYCESLKWTSSNSHKVIYIPIVEARAHDDVFFIAIKNNVMPSWSRRRMQGKKVIAM